MVQMAQHTIVQYVDDLDGSEASGPVEFAHDGKHFEIDLSDDNASKLRDVLAPYVAAARRASGTSRRSSSSSAGSSTADRQRNQEIRTWLRENGYTVPDRGRISSDLLEAYNEGKAAEVTDEAAAETVAEEVAEKPKRTRSRSKAKETETSSNVVEFQAASGE